MIQRKQLGCLLFICLLLDPIGVATSDLSGADRRVLATIEWVPIPEGEFIMGSTPEEIEAAYQDAKLRSSMLERHTFEAELPQHRVFLDAYEISRYEITNAQYRLFIRATRRPGPRGYQGEDTWADETLNQDKQPVVGVTWFDAQACAEWFGGSLPTEAQWELAARGMDQRGYPWGDTPPRPQQHANFARRYNRPTPVGQFPKGASPKGVFDLAGNVWEWCQSRYQPYPCRAVDGREDLILPGNRVLNGGSFAVWDVEYSGWGPVNTDVPPNMKCGLFGFRVVVEVAPES